MKIFLNSLFLKFETLNLALYQRPSAAHGPFEGFSSYHLLCWWSLIGIIISPTLRDHGCGPV
jgi:hypothetical protein